MLVFGAMGGVVSLLILILDIVAIIDIIKSRAPDANKLLWVLLVLFLPVLGMILYFLIGKGQSA